MCLVVNVAREKFSSNCVYNTFDYGLMPGVQIHGLYMCFVEPPIVDPLR